MAIRTDIDQERVAQEVAGLWEDWIQERRPLQTKWDDCVRSYLCEIDESRYEGYPWRSKVADTFSQETADTIASNLRNMLFPINEQYMEVKGLDQFSEGQPALRMQQHQERMHIAGDFIHKVMPWIKQLTVIGNAPYLMPWGPLRPRIRKRRAKVTPAGQRVVKVEEVVLGMREGLKFRCLDAYDVALDPRATDVNKSAIIWRMEVSSAELDAMPRMENLELLEEDTGRKPEGSGQEFKRERQRAYGLEEDTNEDKPFEILMLYIPPECPIVLDDQPWSNMVVAVVNRTVTARFEEEPFWAGRPIGWAGYDPLWVSVYSRGALEPVRGTQELLDTFQNQKVDILNLIINPMYKYIADGVLDPDALISRPGGGVEVGTLENLVSISPTGNVALTYTELDMLRARGERSTGASRFDMGQVPGGRRTAYEANLIRAGGSSRSQDIVRYIANSAMEHFVNFSILTTQQMKWPEGERDGLDEDTLLGDYYAQFTGAHISIVRQQELQSQLLYFQVAAQSPEVAAATDMTVLAKKLAKNLAMDDPHLIVDRQVYEQRLRQMTARAQGAGPQGEQGQVGGANESLMSFLENIGARGAA